MASRTALFVGCVLFLPLAWTSANDKPHLVLDAGGHTGAVSKLIFAPHGRELITVARDKTIRIWDVESGEPVRVLRPPTGEGTAGSLFAASVSPDSRLVAVGGSPPQAEQNGFPIFILALDDGKSRLVLTGHTRTVMDLAFAPDGLRLASCSEDGTVRLWELINGSCVRVLRGHQAMVRQVVYSPDGRFLATASHDHSAKVWDTSTGHLVASLEHPKAVRGIAWSPDGWTIATACADECLRLWTPAGTVVQALEGWANDVTSLSYSRDSRRLLCTHGAAAKNECVIVDISKTSKWRVFAQRATRFKMHSSTVHHGTFSPDGTLVASTGGHDHETYIWRAEDGGMVHRLAAQGRAVWAVGWSEDGASLAWGNQNVGPNNNSGPLERAFVIADLQFGDGVQKRKSLSLFSGRDQKKWLRAHTKQSAIALTSNSADTVMVKRGRKDVAIIQLEPEQGAVLSYTLTSNNRVAVGTNRGLFLYDALTGRLIRAFASHVGAVLSLCPSPDFKYILSGCSDMTLRVWDPDHANPLLSLFVAQNDWIAWSAEGYYATSAGGEQLIGWSIDRGPLTPCDFHPATSFRKSLYRPEKLKGLLASGHPGRLSTEVMASSVATTSDRIDSAAPANEPNGVSADVPVTNVAASDSATARSPTSAVPASRNAHAAVAAEGTVTSVLPPVVEIAQPLGAEVKLQQSRLEVRARAASVSSHPITKMRLLLDGRPYEGNIEAPGAVTLASANPFTQTVDAPTGEAARAIQRARVADSRPHPHSMTRVSGENLALARASKTILVADERSQEVRWILDVPPGVHRVAVVAETSVSVGRSSEVVVEYRAEENNLPRLYVLSIGVAYNNPEWALNYTAADADAVARAFRDRSRKVFRAVEHHVITGPEATRAQIARGFIWLRNQMTQHDVAIIFFAGHGLRDHDGMFYLFPADGDPDALLATGVSETVLKDTLQGMPGRVMLLLDACHSGSVNLAQHLRQRGLEAATDDLVRDLVTDDYGVIVMAASTSRESSLESREWGHGAFTKALVEGLSGAADYNKDQTVYLNELDLFVSERVKKLTGGRQHPVTAKPSSVRSFPLARQ